MNPSTILAVSICAIALGILAYSVWRVSRDRQRPSNGAWLLAGICLLWFSAFLAAVSLPSDGVPGWLVATVVLPLFGALFLLIATPIALIANTPVVVRREGLRVATLVPLAIAVAITGTLVAFFWWFLIISNAAPAPQWVTYILLPVLIIPGAVLIFELVAYTAYALLYPRLNRTIDADVIVVLGAGLQGDKVTPLLASRLDRGISLFQSITKRGDKSPVLVVSGGKGSDEVVAEADAMGDYLLRQGVSADHIVRERNSTNTAENLAFTVDELKKGGVEWRDMAIVTNGFHVLRSASLARHIEGNTVAVGSKTAAYYIPSAFLREFAATVVHYRRATLVACGSMYLIWFAFLLAITLFSN